MMAAVYASRAGLCTLILETTGPGGQILSTSEIDNFPGFVSITGAELAMKLNEQVESCGVETIYDEIMSFRHASRTERSGSGACVLARSANEERGISGTHTVVCNDTTLVAKAIIIATGASPRKLGCEGEEKFIGNGIHFCALCDGAFYKDKNIIIVGGGNSAVEEILYLLPIVKNITVVNAFPNFTAFPSLLEKLPKDLKVYHNTTIKEITGDKRPESIKLSSGETLVADGVFVAIGRKPNTDFLGGAIELSEQGYILVSKKLETNIPGVYAAGDVCEKHVRQIVTACADGCVAATHAAEYIRNMT